MSSTVKRSGISQAMLAMIAAGMGSMAGMDKAAPRIRLFGINKLNNRSKYIPAGVNRNVQQNVLKRYRLADTK